MESGESRSKASIIEGILKVMRIYYVRGFKVVAVHADGEFDLDALRSKIRPVHLEIKDREEHDGVIERSVRTVKERSRCTCHSLPYEYYPKLMTRSMVEGVVNWLNAFPFKSGVSQTMGPSTIILGKPAPDVSRKSAVFGSYAMGFTKTKNDMTERSEHAISLGTLNDSGAHYFMSLKTGKKIKCHRWEELPITDDVIKRVEQLGKEQNQIKLIDGFPLFEWEDGKHVEDDHNEGEIIRTIGDLIDDDGDEDSSYAPSEVNDEDLEEQRLRVDEIENNIDNHHAENVVTDNEDEIVENEDKIKRDENEIDYSNEIDDGLSESENEYEFSGQLDEDDLMNDKDMSNTSIENEMKEDEIENNDELPSEPELRRTTRIKQGTGV